VDPDRVQTNFSLDDRAAHSSSIIPKAADRSEDLSFKKAALARLTSAAPPLVEAVLRSTVVGWSTPQINSRALAKRAMVVLSIDVSSMGRSRALFGVGRQIDLAQDATTLEI
jgi:hypothetical protein